MLKLFINKKIFLYNKADKLFYRLFRYYYFPSLIKIMKQLPELVASNKVIMSKYYSEGSAFIIELTPEMIAVLVYRSLSEEPVYSRAYFCSESNKKEILLAAKRQYRYLKECLMQKKYELLEDLD